MADPYDAFSTPVQTPAAQTNDPYAAFSSPAPAASEGTDLGAEAAAQRGLISGIPILGPALEKAEDYVGSRLGAAISGKTPEEVGATAKAIGEKTDAAHPFVHGAASLASGIAATEPLMAAAPALFGVAPGALTVGKVAAGLGSGAAIGGTDAAVRSGGDPGSIAAGAALGGLGGAAGPLLGAAAGRVGEALADHVAHTRALSNIGVSKPAAEILTRAAEADGTLGGRGAANIAAAGPQGMLADAGPAAQNVLDTAIQRGGPGAVAARQAIEQRAAGADTELTGALDQALGAPQGIKTAADDIRNSTAQARGDAYDTAYSEPIDYSSDEGQALEKLVRDRVPAGIIARANNQMRIDGDTSSQILARVGDDGSVTYEKLPDVRQLDYITRSLNDVAQRGDGQGALGGNTSEGRSYGNLARDIRGQLRQAVPAYGVALDTAAQPIQAKNALEFGSTMLRPNVARDEVADTIGQMTQPELRQARLGLRSQMAETLANVKRTITDPNVDARQAMDVVKQLSSDAAQEKVGLLVSKQEQAALTQALDRATRALELRASVATNSRTAARTITNDTIKDAAAPGPIAKLASGEPLKAGKAVAQFLTRNRPSDVTRREDAIYSELADALTRYRGDDAVSFLNRLQQAHATRAAANSFATNLPYGRVASAGLLGGLIGLARPGGN